MRTDKIKTIAMHSAIWGLYVITFSSWLSIFWGDQSFSDYVIETLKILPVNMLVTYISIYFLLPSFFREKNYTRSILSILLVITVSLPVQEFIMNGNFFTRNLFANFLETTFIVSIGIALVMPKNWLTLFFEKQALEKDKVKAELAALKSQINPHFFFNTLNNIYSLVVRNENGKAAQIIEELSDLMSKVLYESNLPRITLEKELEILNHYIRIQKIRFEENMDINSELQIQDNQLLIPPMILFIFVENCFKHSGNNVGEKISISLEIATKDKVVSFRAVNTLPENVEGKQKGAGIENTRKRLNLIYKSGFDLVTSKQERKFIVELNIDTAHDTKN